MKTIVLILGLVLLSTVAYAADGIDFSFPQPTGTPASTNTCIDVCNKANPNGAITCGPIWAPVQNAAFNEFRVVATTTPACAFDTLDIIEWNTATAPSSEAIIILGTLDDDGAVDCGLGVGVACKALRVTGPIYGYVYIDSNGATVGGASCTSFKLLLCQTPPK